MKITSAVPNGEANTYTHKIACTNTHIHGTIYAFFKKCNSFISLNNLLNIVLNYIYIYIFTNQYNSYVFNEYLTFQNISTFIEMLLRGVAFHNILSRVALCLLMYLTLQIQPCICTSVLNRLLAGFFR